ncbi:MAG: hypothetical protein QW514_10280 [Thermoprotei archaeon]
MKFDDVFKEAVEEAFSAYGLVGPVMIKDIETRTGVKVSKWWKNPDRIEKVIMSTYGQGGRAITSNITTKLLARLPQHLEVVDQDFSETIKEIVNQLKKLKQI